MSRSYDTDLQKARDILTHREIPCKPVRLYFHPSQIDRVREILGIHKDNKSYEFVALEKIR